MNCLDRYGSESCGICVGLWKTCDYGHKSTVGAWFRFRQFQVGRIEKTDPLYSKSACPKWDYIRRRALSALH